MKSPQTFYLKWRNQRDDVNDLFEFAAAYEKYCHQHRISEWLKKHVKKDLSWKTKREDDTEEDKLP